MSDERKLRTETKENKTTETLEDDDMDVIEPLTRGLVGASLFTMTETIDDEESDEKGTLRRSLTSSNQITSGARISEISISQSPDAPGFSSGITSESKARESRTSSTVEDLALSLLHRQPSSDAPRFDSMLGDNEWNRDDDDDDDSDDDSDDDDLPQMVPGGMPIGGFLAMGDDDSDDELPVMTPGLVRQNGYYRAETSHDFMAQRSAA